MATVYLAEDLRHHRQVALKVLKPEIAATLGPGRFAREIEVAARLQHPNILPLLDSGEAAGVFFYVMPFVEGESLRERLARGGELPIPDAVRILMEVADALSHAHAHGVVHRDIKPDNVMLSGRHALVTDFGVAKAVTAATGQQLLTSTGVALGTPTYMAPEQATADKQQDHRVDIYALGVLGYELLTGRAPFSATTAQEMLAAHLVADPEPLEQHRPGVNPAVAQVVLKCLAKKPADRWQTAEEVREHLEPLATPSGGTTPTRTRPVGAVARIPSWARWTASAAALALVALAAGRLLPPRSLHVTASDIAPVTNEPGLEIEPAISPDGKQVAYVAGGMPAGRLLVRNAGTVSGGAAVLLGDTAAGDAMFPAWTPDGQSLRYVTCDGDPVTCGWRVTGSLGGAVRAMPAPHGSWLSWSPDGERAAFVRSETLFVATATDTVALQVGPRTDWSAAIHSLAWSPDGKRIAFVAGNPAWPFRANVGNSSIWVVNADGRGPRRIVGDAHLNVSPAWLDERHLLFVSNRDGSVRGVYVVEVGPDGPRGVPRAVPGIADPHSISYSVAARRLAFSRFVIRANIWAYPLEPRPPVAMRDGDPVTRGSEIVEEHDVSPDGKWIAYSSNLRGSADLYKVPLAGGDIVPLTSTPTRNEGGPRWSPDGREIAFTASLPGGGYDVFTMPAEGGAAVRLFDGPDTAVTVEPRWLHDGLGMSFISTRREREPSWLASRDSVGGAWHEPVPLRDSLCCLYAQDWAPGGSAFVSNRGDERNPGVGTIAVVRADGSVSRRPWPAAGELQLAPSLRYARDGRTVYGFAVHRDGRMGVWAIPVAGGAPRLLVVRRDPALRSRGFLSIGPDRLYLTVIQIESDIWVAMLHY